jgi:hypothetical protein
MSVPGRDEIIDLLGDIERLIATSLVASPP